MASAVLDVRKRKIDPAPDVSSMMGEFRSGLSPGCARCMPAAKSIMPDSVACAASSRVISFLR